MQMNRLGQRTGDLLQKNVECSGYHCQRSQLPYQKQVDHIRIYSLNYVSVL
jgi:hypothetical protein